MNVGWVVLPSSLLSVKPVLGLESRDLALLVQILQLLLFSSILFREFFKLLLHALRQDTVGGPIVVSVFRSYKSQSRPGQL